MAGVRAIVVGAAIAAALPAGAQATAAGAALYKARCGTCHAIDLNRTGPMHRGLIGRKAASVPGYAYSPALAASGLVWTEASIDRWLQGPQKMVKGSRMFLVVTSAADRAAIIAFLATQQ